MAAILFWQKIGFPVISGQEAPDHQDRHTDGWNESAVRYTGSGLFQTKPHG